MKEEVESQRRDTRKRRPPSTITNMCMAEYKNLIEKRRVPGDRLDNSTAGAETISVDLPADEAQALCGIGREYMDRVCTVSRAYVMLDDVSLFIAQLLYEHGVLISGGRYLIHLRKKGGK